METKTRPPPNVTNRRKLFALRDRKEPTHMKKNFFMIWFDNDQKKKLADKIADGVAHFKNKYKKAPNLCTVHPSQVGDQTILPLDGVKIQASNYALKNDIWLEIADS